MFPCVIPGCAAMAEKDGGECAAHAAGYRKHDGGRELRCDHCRRLIAQDDWYRRNYDDNSVRHVRPCTVHPEVDKEQKKAEQAAAR